jgi:flagellar biosynthesis/type III secretory pathway protein FliH
MEEQKMLATEWKLEEALQVRCEEGIEKGLEEGWDKGIEKERKWIMSLLAQGKSADELKQIIESAPMPTRKSGIGN